MRSVSCAVGPTEVAGRRRLSLPDVPLPHHAGAIQYLLPLANCRHSPHCWSREGHRRAMDIHLCQLCPRSGFQFQYQLWNSLHLPVVYLTGNNSGDTHQCCHGYSVQRRGDFELEVCGNRFDCGRISTDVNTSF